MYLRERLFKEIDYLRAETFKWRALALASLLLNIILVILLVGKWI